MDVVDWMDVNTTNDTDACPRLVQQVSGDQPELTRDPQPTHTLQAFLQAQNSLELKKE